jgi:hypothetical protein
MDKTPIIAEIKQRTEDAAMHYSSPLDVVYV